MNHSCYHTDKSYKTVVLKYAPLNVDYHKTNVVVSLSNWEMKSLKQTIRTTITSRSSWGRVYPRSYEHEKLLTLLSLLRLSNKWTHVLQTMLSAFKKPTIRAADFQGKNPRQAIKWNGLELKVVSTFVGSQNRFTLRALRLFI